MSRTTKAFALCLAMCAFASTAQQTDNLPPTVVTQDIAVNLNPFSSTVNISAAQIDNGSFDDITAQENLTLSLSQTTFECADIDGTTVTLTVADEAGNSAEGTAIVTVVDSFGPIVPFSATFPDVEATGLVGCGAVLPDYRNVITAQDNCGSENVLVTQDPAPGSLLADGDHTITITFSDQSGNATSRDFIFNVQELEQPAFSVTTNGNDNSATVSWEPIASSYRVRYRAGVNSPWTTVNNATSPLTLEGLASGTAYQVRLQSRCNGNTVLNQRKTFTSPGEPLCAEPTFVQISATTQESATLLLPPGSGTYDIWYRSGPRSRWTKTKGKEAGLAIGSNQVQIEGLASGMQYDVRVYRNCDGVTSAPKLLEFRTDGPTACPVPEVAVASVSENTATLTFPNNPGTYAIWFRGGFNAPWTRLDNFTFPVPPVPIEFNQRILFDLESGTNYTVRVFRICDEVSTVPTTLNFTTSGSAACPAPTSQIGIENVGENSAEIAFPPLSDQQMIIRYRGGVGSPWVQESLDFPEVNGGTIPAISYGLTGLASGTRYNVRIHRKCGNITSAPLALNFETEGEAACATPEGRIEQVTDETAQLFWPAQPGKYEVWYRAGTGAPWMKEQLDFGPLPLEEYSILLGGLASGTRYVVRLYRMCSDATSAPFTESFTTNGEESCDAPEVSVNEITGTTATVTWTGPGDNYILRYRSGSFGSWTRVEDVTSPYSLSELQVGTPYFVRVFAVCDGITSIAGGATFTTDGDDTCAPSATTVSEVTENTANISWTMQEGADYELRYRPGPTSDWINVSAAISPVALENLAPGTTYNTQLYTICGELTSEASSTDFTTLGTAPCNRPEVTISSVSETAATISWEGSSDIDNVWYRPGVLSPWTKVEDATSPYIAEDLETGTTYQVRVFIECGNVSSSPGTEFFTTLGESVCPTPALTLGEPTETSMEISWTATSGDYALWYRIAGGSWTEVYGITATSYTLSALQPGTDYNLRLYAICGDVNAQQAAADFRTPGSASAKVASQTTGQDLASTSLPLKVFPVPANLQLHIQLPSNAGVVEHLTIHDLSGRNRVVPITSFQGQHALDIRHLDEGSYFLRLIVDGEESTHRFIVIR